MDRIVLAKEGRDAQIEQFKHCLRVMGAAIPGCVLCYNFMPWSFRVGRTSYEAAARGGALTSEWRMDQFDNATETEDGQTSHDDMWANLEYFLKAVIPVAEEANVYMACHPDDPPLLRIKGLARILHSPEGKRFKIVNI